MVLGIASQAAIPERNGNIRNGVIRTGAALSRILTIDSPESLLRKCYNENIGSRLFSDSCLELIEQLQQKTGLMTVESDIQMQAERIDPLLRKSKNQERLEMLAKLNLVSTQAVDAIKALRASVPENRYQDHLGDILPVVEKVRIAYESYLKAAGP